MFCHVSSNNIRFNFLTTILAVLFTYIKSNFFIFVSNLKKVILLYIKIINLF